MQKADYLLPVRKVGHQIALTEFKKYKTKKDVLSFRLTASSSLAHRGECMPWIYTHKAQQDIQSVLFLLVHLWVFLPEPKWVCLHQHMPVNLALQKIWSCPLVLLACDTG